MKVSRSLLIIISALLVSLSMVAATRAQQTASPSPGKIVQQMCDYLKSLHQFSYHAEVIYDAVEADGKKVRHAFTMETYVRRPDRLRVDAAGDVINKQFFFDGKTITLYDKNSHVYATIDVPPDIEDTLDKAQKDFNLRVALSDLASPKLYEHLSPGLAGARNLGIEKVRGVPSHHLAIDRPEAQLELWVDAGQKPLLRKVVIVEKNPPLSPTWTAYLDKWNSSPRIDDNKFTFVLPSGVKKIEFIPVQHAAAPGK